MKALISSDAWEKRKALIAKLYMEEEWPLKQVIKQIRSDHFNPSETQLRSRLKKWRVTKPSRQVRKKPQGLSISGDDADSKKKDVKRSSASSPRNQRPSSAAMKVSESCPEWPGVSPFATPDGQFNVVDNNRDAPLVQQLTLSPPEKHALVSDGYHPVHNLNPHSTTASCENPTQASPANVTLMLNTTPAVTPTYTGYPPSPESCLPSPILATAPALAPWTPRSVSVDMSHTPAMHPGHWYPVSFEPITPPIGVPHSGSGHYDRLHMAAHSVPGAHPHEFPQCGEVPELHGYYANQWKQAMSLEEDLAGHDRRPEQAYQKPLPPHSPLTPAMISLPLAQRTGPHAVMCAPILPYMGHDPMAQKPSGVGYS